jgi:acetyl-CoA acetyltransferase
MTRAPWVLQKPDRAFPAGTPELYSTTLGWRMTNPGMNPEWTIPLGEGAELIADKHKITREQQDEFALASHEKAARAWKDGSSTRPRCPVSRRTDLVFRDETVRDATSMESLAKLKPPSATGGTVTAGNASPLNDGAAALLLVDEEGLKATGREPLARVGATAVTGIDPSTSASAPSKPSTAPSPRRARASPT